MSFLYVSINSVFFQFQLQLQLTSVVHVTAANTTRLCSASSLGCQHGTARICCSAPCCGSGVAAGRPPLSIDIFCLRGAQQQTCHTLLQQSIEIDLDIQSVIE